MKKFEVEVKHRIYIDSETLQEANKQMLEKYPEFETVNFYDMNESKNHEVIGHCELSDLSIFETDDFSYDVEGVMWLNNLPESD